VSSLIRRSGPFAEKNARLFVLFTTLYNARAYYPVLAILFTDLGLKLEHYVLLNAVWAAAIFLLEVPSGALADVLGRKRLLVFSSVLMVAEMAILLFAPKDGGILLFALCLLNRFLSGASEAAASGADEAIAYDSLPENDGRKSAWDEVLATAMRWRAAGFLIAMTAGGLLYDPSWLNALLPETMQVPVDVARRLPVALVLLQAVGCLLICLRFEETHPPAATSGACRNALRLTLRTARMAFTTRAIAVVLVGGFMIDAVARNFATLVSEYYRLIGIPGWAFGVIGSLIAVGNWFIPGIAARVNRRHETLTALLMGGAVAALGLWMLVPAWPWAGLLPVALLMMMLGYVGFTVSRHLHEVAASYQRATLLSVKGLVFNLAYGTYSLAFSLTLAGMGKSGPAAMQQALGWQAAAFTAILAGFAIVAHRQSRNRRAG
jgi:MFS family permease